MKKIILREDKKYDKQKCRLRIKSFATAMLMAVSSIPMWIFPELNIFSSLQLNTVADDVVYEDWTEKNGVYIISTQVDLERYSQAYYSHPENHIRDTIELSIGSGSTRYPITNFISIGNSGAPFQGVLKTNEGSLTSLNLDEPLFDYVCDNVQIIEKTSATNGAGQLIFTRTENNTNAPLFANHVVHYTGNDSEDNETNAAVGWNLLLNQFKPDDQNTWNHNFAGIIGEIDDNALVSVTFTDTTSGVVSGAGDTGLFCGSMGDNSQLTVSIGDGSTNTGYTVTSSDGNAGGVIGSMGDGAVLTLCSQIGNVITSVTTQETDKYAGGIIGCNNGGEIILDSEVFSSSTYTISGEITGNAGAGSIAGYYRPKFNTEAASFDTSKYAINTTVNGNGSVGGLFGVLENKTVVNDTDAAGGTITILSTPISTIHNSGNMTNYGGLIGKYSTYSLNETLTISNASVSVSKDSNSTYTNYGGCIGLVDGTGYVKVDGFMLSSATNISAHTFGGVVGRADSGYVDVSGITIGTASGNSSTVVGYYGGGIVGSLGNGVLKMSGTVDLTNALPEAGNGPTYYNHGQIVGYCDNALVYADDWTFSRSNREVDNIGSWGDVMVFGGHLTKADVLTENSDHTISITAPGAAVNSEEEFAKTALGLQIDYDANPILSGTAVASNTSLTFGDTIDLTGTGLRGLTRDNAESDSLSAAHCVYSGTVTGDSANIILDVQNVGGKPVYRHIYNGLFGIADGINVNSLTLGGTVNIKANKGTMYAGALASRATGAFTASSITDTGQFTADGGNTVYLGRLLGEASSAIDTITINGTNSFSGNVTSANSSDSTCLGGVIGKISHNTYSQARTWNISGVTLSGEIKNTSPKHTQKIGGLIAEITSNYDVRYNTQNRTLTLDTIAVDNLTVEGALGRNNNEVTDENFPNLSSGGLFGYLWLSVESELKNITVSNSKVNLSSNTENFGDTAGLVYQATGKMTVNSVAINGISLNGETKNAVRSFGVLVNKGWYSNYGSYDRQALYIDLPENYSYTIENDNFSADGLAITDFDEILTYSATYHQANTGNSTCVRGVTDSAANDGTVSDIMVNGQGIVSIDSPAFKTDGSNTSATYEPRTIRGKTANPYSRYYYNLSALSGSSDNTAKLVVWGAKQYACANIKQYFNDNSFAFDAAETYQLQNYSWYPIDYSGSVAGTFKLFNKEFEDSENLNTTTWSSLTEGNSATQHFMMQNGLFHDVNGTLNVGAVTLQGNVGATSNGSGALVCGVVSGSAEETAVIDSSNGSMILDGIYIHNLSSHSDYAPLLINKSGDFSYLDIENVSVKSDSSYKTNTSIPVINEVKKAATSLVGNAGKDTSSRNINILFNKIQLDGRRMALTDTTADATLTSKYHTDLSLFTHSTLLEMFIYGSGSSGVYNYEYGEDWGTNNNRFVTYGSEISDSTSRNQYYGEEFWYNNEDHNSGYYTQYSGGSASGTAPVDFSGFLPYVYAASTKANVSTEKKHQLKVNHTAAELGGCGTYNHPFEISSGAQLKTMYDILHGDTTSAAIYLPVVANDDTLKKTTWDSGKTCVRFKMDTNDSNKFKTIDSNGAFTDTKSYSQAAVRTYLAGAYYSITESFEISDTEFNGLGSLLSPSDTYAVFRGVIVGNNNTITNSTGYPLIATSYGSVVKDVSIVVGENVSLSQDSKNTFDISKSCKNYGAVIGQILGGDNIIDGVTVNFAAGKTITLSGNYAQLIPVGGYVGVVVNGGLYFRGMETEGSVLRGTSAIQGIPADSTIVTDGTDTNLVAEDNTKWLYVNPIVGRVLNGFAVTEGEAYRPFEDKNREGYDEALSVTMKNGNKNYSIADIDESAKLSTTKSLDVGNIYKNDDNIIEVTAPDSQSFFIMSLIVASGAGAADTATGEYYKTSGYDKTYKTPNNALYTNVGTAQDVDDQDYQLSLIKNSNGNANAVLPYIIRNYTKQYTDNNYYARAITCKATSIYLKMSKLTYTLPDGYKGLGQIYSIASDDDLLYNSLKPYGIVGNDAHFDLYMHYYSYHDTIDNYEPHNQRDGAGFGLFNVLIQRHGISKVDSIKNDKGYEQTINDIIISGSVVAEMYYFSGDKITYSDNEVNSYNKAIHTGGLAGSIVSWNNSWGPYTYTINNIEIKNILIDGPKYSGSICGHIFSVNLYIYGVSSNGFIIVRSGKYAGGLIGNNANNIVLTIDGAINSEPDNDPQNSNIKLSEVTIKTESTSDSASGGIIGEIEGNSTIEIKHLNIIPYEESKATYVGIKSEGIDSSAVGYAGGILGRTHTTQGARNITIEDTIVKNINIQGRSAGGVIGYYYTRGNSYFSIVNTQVVSDAKNEICGVVYAGGLFAYAYVQYPDTSINSTINHCIVENYTIKTLIEVTKESTCGGFGGRLAGDGNSNYLDSYWYNSAVRNCILYTNMNSTNRDDCGIGVLLGSINQSKNKKKIYGYNLLSYENTILYPRKSNEKNAATFGLLIGNNRGNFADIRLVGVTIQNDKTTNLTARFVGSQGKTATENYYGENGYIIFSDYEGKCLTDSKSETFSPITNSTNVTAYDGTAVTDNTPYVTSSPKMQISDSQFLTGDGVSALAYGNSVAKAILDDITAGTSAKRYKNTTLSNTVNGITSSLTASAFSAQLASKLSTYQAEMGDLAGTTYNFPVLIFDDTTADNTTNLLNNYLRALTNTSYDFATDQAGIYAVKTAKCTWNGTDFTADYTTSNLIHQNGKFYMENDKVDNAAVDSNGNPVGQFSLVDVEFYDPSDSTKVAYHLYVPVVVKKLMKFEFESSLLSGTTYRAEPYLANRANTLIENLGTPVTMQFRYTYQQSLQDWQNAIYSGDSVLYSFNKVLLFDNKATAGSIPSMNMVLIDVNQGRKSYTAALDDSGVYTNSKLDLQKFTDSSDNAYQSVLFNDYFSITAGDAGTDDVKFSEVSLTEGVEKTVEKYIAAGATVRDSSGKYYKRDDNGTVKLTVSYADNASTVTRTVEGTPVQYLQEDYYLSYYTSTQNNKIAHFEIDSVTAFDNTSHPTRRETSSVCHLYLGDIFDNVLTVTPTNQNSKISNANHTIGADLNAIISLKASAKNYVQAAITRIPNVDIYQSFMVSLRKQNSTTDYTQGIAVKPTIQLSNTQVGTGASTEDWKYYISSNYIELRSNVDLQDYLKNSDSVNVTARIAMTYSTASDSTDITDQFPYRTQEQENDSTCVIGTKIIGYSSIASAPSTAVYSKASEEKTTAILYYCTITTNAELNYMSNASATNRANGIYDQLGINALESSATSMKIDTLAEYRTGKLTTLTYTPARMTIDVEFSKKGNYGTPLDIPTYLTEFNLYGVNGNSDTGYSVITGRTETVVDNKKTKYTYIIENPQSMLNYDSTNKIYSIPIDFTAITGTALESAGLDYANYMVKLTVRLYKLENGEYEYIPGSLAYDHIIYTNTKVLSTLVTGNGS